MVENSDRKSSLRELIEKPFSVKIDELPEYLKRKQKRDAKAGVFIETLDSIKLKGRTRSTLIKLYKRQMIVTPSDVSNLSDEELLSVEQVGHVTLSNIREAFPEQLVLLRPDLTSEQ